MTIREMKYLVAIINEKYVAEKYLNIWSNASEMTINYYNESNLAKCQLQWPSSQYYSVCTILMINIIIVKMKLFQPMACGK